MAAQGRLVGKMVIGQSGGPTVVINQSLVGAVLAARRQSSITGILGARHGIAGIMKEDFIDLTTQSIEQLELVASTPEALSTSYFTGSACLGISTMTLHSWGRLSPGRTFNKLIRFLQINEIKSAQL